jgi:hypothetical protein
MIMFQAWRLKLREAQEAFKAGDLTEACRLLLDGKLTEFLPGRKLAAQVAEQKAQRAKDLAQRGEMDSGWRELESAKQLAGETATLQRASRALVESALAKVRRLICMGEASSALQEIESLEKRKVDPGQLSALKQVAQRVHSAANLANRGKFAEADAQLAAAIQLRPNYSELNAVRQDYREKAERARFLTEQLHRAMAEKAWSDVVPFADQLVELAPESPLARDARKQAWTKVGAKFADSPRIAATQEWVPSGYNNRSRQSEDANGERFVLWVDGVGGYLVCLEGEVVIGQAAPGNLVDIPVLADISRRHAKIRREGEGYVIEPLHVLRINNRSVQTKTILKDGDEIELGAGVRFRFRRPHALSASARLDMISRHRTQPYADSILLMAESCVLGPRWQNHVVCQEWEGDVVLYRQDDDLYCRAMDAIEIDGELCDGRGRLTSNSHVAGSDFSMSLEELDRCTTQPLL